MAKKNIRTVGVKLNMDAEVIPVTSQLVSRIVKAAMVMHKMFDGGIILERQVLIDPEHPVEGIETKTVEELTNGQYTREYGYISVEGEMLQEIDEQVMSILDDLVSAFENE